MSFQLVRYEAARQALAECRRIDDAADIRDKAAALEAYARQRADVELERWVAEIKLRAIVRIGELSKDLQRTDDETQFGGCRSGATPAKRAVLKAAGISKDVAHRAERLADAAPEVEAYIARKAGEGRPVKISEALAAAEAQRRESAAREVLHAAPVDMPEGLHVGDFRQLADVIPDASVDLIFTDPPYDREAIGLFEDAARIGARILKPGGSLIAYCGQIQLPDVLAGMAKHLRYWWVNACIHSGSTRLRMTKYGIVNQWKPLVWFVKGTRGDVQTFVDDAVSGGTEKAHHPWQQAQSEAAYYINSLCSPEGVVVDFCAGGGTTLAAARAVGRKCIGFELDELHAAEIARRLAA